jgi:hypothetical protein
VIAGCASSGPKASLEDAISGGIPGAEDVECTQTEGDHYRCTATVHGKAAVIQGTAGANGSFNWSQDISH